MIKNKIKHCAKIVISLGLSILLMVFLIRKYDIPNIGELFEDISLCKYIFGFISALMVYLFSGLRWKYLFPSYSYLHSVNGVVVAVAANTIIPARGGELFRSFIMKRVTGITVTKGIGNIIIERSMDFFVLFIFLIVSLSILGNKLRSDIVDSKTIIIVICFLSVALILIIFFKNRLFRFVEKFADRMIVFGGIRKYAATKMLDLVDGFRRIKVSEYLIGLIITISITCFSVLSMYFYISGCGAELSIKDAFCIYPLIALSISLPVSVGYVGVYHASMIGALSIIGVNNPQIVGIVILVHMFTVIPPVFYGSLVSFYYYMKKREVRFENNI